MDAQQMRDAVKRYRDSERGKAQRAAYRKTDVFKEGSRNRMARWRRQNPDRWQATNMAGGANTRAQKLGISGRLSTADVLALWERQPVCVACGNGRGLDHIVALSRGGRNTPDNLQTLCPPCNSRKGILVDRAAGRPWSGWGSRA